MAGPRTLTSLCCLLAVFSFVTGCKKHQQASIPVPPPARVRVTKARTPSSTTPSTANSPAASVPAAESPRLGQILSPSEERQYNALIDQSLSRTQTSLNLLAGRKLTAEQQSSMREIQEFMRQAQVTRNSDLLSAKALADKAQVLARDLAAAMR